jgi:hypothetical protein
MNVHLDTLAHNFFLSQNPDLLRKNTGTNIPIKQERYMKNLGEDSRRCQQRALEARRRLHRSGELCQGQQPEVLQDRGHTDLYQADLIVRCAKVGLSCSNAIRKCCGE